MINTKRLRCMIGWLGMLLPWMVAALVGYIPESISATYYTNAVAVFMIVLGSAGLLLVSYKGYQKIDDIVNTLAGIAGLMICLFPCWTWDYELVGTFQIPRNISNIIHTVSACIFFGLLAFNSLFLFTKTNGEMTKKKKARNIIYRVCGVGMILSFVLLFFVPKDGTIAVWVVETIALFFFAISWLTKANQYKILFKE